MHVEQVDQTGSGDQVRELRKLGPRKEPKRVRG